MNTQAAAGTRRRRLLQTIAGVGLVAAAGTLVMDSLQRGRPLGGESVAQAHAAPARTVAGGGAEAPSVAPHALPVRAQNASRRLEPVATTRASAAAEVSVGSVAVGPEDSTVADLETPGHAAPVPTPDHASATGPCCSTAPGPGTHGSVFPPLAVMLAACASTDRLLRSLDRQAGHM